MTTPGLDDRLGAAREPVRAFLGAEVSACRYVSTRRPTGHVHGAYRLDLADGRRVKLRLLRDPERAERIRDVLAECDDAGFPRVLLRHDHVLLEEWIEGTPLGPDDRDAPAEAGDLLGRLHARRRFRGAPLDATVSTAAERARLEEQLAELRDAGRLDPAAAATLAARAARADPGRTAFGLAHGDLCAENMLRDARGRLRVIDNERMGPASLIHDLERARYRWPLPAAGWAAFTAAYAAHRDPTVGDGERTFWMLRTLVQSAHVRALRWGGDARAPLAALRALLAGAPESDSAGAGA